MYCLKISVYHDTVLSKCHGSDRPTNNVIPLILHDKGHELMRKLRAGSCWERHTYNALDDLTSFSVLTNEKNSLEDDQRGLQLPR